LIEPAQLHRATSLVRFLSKREEPPRKIFGAPVRAFVNDLAANWTRNRIFRDAP
jgi:hypothetical protein